jgi:LDH2 family malate/lactate/ureidoglycolate dehydrogenase
MPGERGIKKRDEQLKSGVALHEDIMPSLKRWADKLSVTLPEPLARPM